MIKEFSGNHRWLSNFYPVDIEWEDYIYPSVEHAYQAQKNDSPEWKVLCSDKRPPGYIKKMSRSIDIRGDWDLIKVKTMESLLDLKFNKEPFQSLLLGTGSEEIQEGNYWRDTFWGVDLNTGKGKNVLGHLIMNIRGDLKFQRFF